ncbi:DegT/DnrJ/EryC1/StrS family aminotransferase [Halomonas organivorans]
MIPYTRPYLPDRERLDRYLDRLYESHWLTNSGELVQELTRRLEDYLGVENLLLVANGTLALQIAYRALGVSKKPASTRHEAITTPFTFIATASSLKWEGIEPVFVDIDPATWCLDPARVEGAITPATKAIVPVHVFGNGCDVEAIEDIAGRHTLKVIYDGAHAFGVTRQGRSLLRHGDAAILSFHATKLFHTIEGGAIVFKCREDLERARRMINFGISGPETIEDLGINAKMNEFQAAMGLCVLEDIERIVEERRAAVERYIELLGSDVILQLRAPSCSRNGAYFPILLDSEARVLDVVEGLEGAGIKARRYFYPNLSELPFFPDGEGLDNSLDIARRILCLPLYPGITPQVQKRVTAALKELL